MASSIEMADRVRALEMRVTDLEGILRVRNRPTRSWSRHVAGWLEIESRLGLTWFNRLGAVALVGALALAAAWANDQGYLSPAVRTVVAGCVAAMLLALSCWKLAGSSGGRRAFFTGISLLGAGGLLVVPATAALVDGLITEAVAMAILVGVVLACLALAALLDVFGLALVATLGGVLVPLVSGAGEPQFERAMFYLAVLGAITIGVQIRRRWIALDTVVFLALSIYSLAWSGSDPTIASAVWASGIWAAAIAYEAWRRHVKRIRRAESQRSSALLAAAIAGGVAMLSAGVLWPAIALVTAHVWVWRDPGRPRQMYALIALCAVGCATFPSALAGAMMLPFLWQAIRRTEWAVAAVAIPTTAWVWATVGIESGQPGLAAVAVAAYAVTCIFIGIDESKRDQLLSAVLIIGGGVCAVIAAWPLAIGVAAAKLSLAMTIAATVVGLALVGIGMGTASKLVRAAGLTLLALVAGKLVVIDVWALSSGTRVLAVCALGLGCLGVSYLYSRVVSSRDGQAANC